MEQPFFSLFYFYSILHEVDDAPTRMRLKTLKNKHISKYSNKQ